MFFWGGSSCTDDVGQTLDVEALSTHWASVSFSSAVTNSPNAFELVMQAIIAAEVAVA